MLLKTALAAPLRNESDSSLNVFCHTIGVSGRRFILLRVGLLRQDLSDFHVLLRSTVKELEASLQM